MKHIYILFTFISLLSYSQNYKMPYNKEKINYKQIFCGINNYNYKSYKNNSNINELVPLQLCFDVKNYKQQFSVKKRKK